MKQVFLWVCLAAAMQTGAQVKSVKQVTDMCTQTTAGVTKTLGAGYWKIESQAKLDTLYYIRWMPKKLDNKNMGQMVMCFYKQKDKPCDFLVFQTLDKGFYDRAKAEMLKGGYKPGKTEDKKNEKKEYFSDGKFDITVTQVRQTDTGPLQYVFGARPEVKTTVAGGKGAVGKGVKR